MDAFRSRVVPIRYQIILPWCRTLLAILGRLWRLLSASPTTLIALSFLLTVVVSGLLADRISAYGSNQQEISARLVAPSWAGGTNAHFLGTDGLGRDVLSRLLHGTRLALLIPLVAVGISLSLGVLLGLIAGYYGGKADAIIMRIVDLQMAFSTLLLILVVVVMIGPGAGTLMLVFGITHWVLYTRIVRGALLSLREVAFVQAARVVGCSNRRIVFVHILPNLVAVLSNVATVEMARLMVAEAALSFLGYGVQPPMVTWGLMIAAGRDYLSTGWWIVTIPGLTMAVTVLSISLVGIGLQEMTSPFQRHLASIERQS